MQNRMHLVFKLGAAVNKRAAIREAQGFGVVIGQPNLRQITNAGEFREDSCVDFVGLHFRLGNNARFDGIGENDGGFGMSR